MKSAAYLGQGRVETSSVAVAPPGAGELQIAVAYCGLCGTDLHLVHGDLDARVSRPLVFGHEVSGTVAGIGADVTGWSVGDPVTVMPLAWDGTCDACRAGHQHICRNLDFLGIDSPGGLQERWNVPATVAVRLPAGLDLRTAALVEPVAVAVHDVRRSGLQVGDRAVVLGGGPIGVLIACVARQAGADVLIAEIDESRRDRIAGLGFTVSDPAGTDLGAEVERWTGGVGADVVFEVSGAAAAVRSATGLARVRNVTMAVREWEGEVVFLHEVAPGAADRSYGIQVARLAGLPERVLSRARQVLGVLESRASGQTSPMLDDLPLFAAAPPPKKPEINPLNAMLDQVRPDDLSPREALELIYELKKARDAGRRS